MRGMRITEIDHIYADKTSILKLCALQDNFDRALWNFSEDPNYCNKKLFDFTPQMAKKYVEDMLASNYVSNNSEVEKTYSPDTIRRYITAIQNAWKWGQEKERELSNLPN